MSRTEFFYHSWFYKNKEFVDVETLDFEDEIDDMYDIDLSEIGYCRIGLMLLSMILAVLNPWTGLITFGGWLMVLAAHLMGTKKEWIQKIENLIFINSLISFAVCGFTLRAIFVY